MPRVPRRTVSVRDIEFVLRDLGGRAHAGRIKDEIEELYGGMPENYANDRSFRNTIQAILNRHRRGPDFGGTEIFRQPAHGEYELIDLAPLLDDNNALTGESNFLEGQSSKNWVVRYERDGRLREAAKTIHGTVCKGCGFDFGKTYGAVLGGGFIEVHHIKPVSTLGGPVEVNPQTDLVVLCSNCHSIVHRHKPAPLSVEALREAIAKASGS